MTEQVQLLIFHLDERSYGLRLAQTQRVVRAVEFVPLPRAPEIVLGAIDVGGEMVPLVNIRRRFGLADRDITVNDQFILGVTSRRRVAFAADAVEGIVERPAEKLVATKSILPGLEQTEGVIQLEGGLIFIHDLERFLSLDEERELAGALEGEPRHGK